jgi:hypothetical protein
MFGFDERSSTLRARAASSSVRIRWRKVDFASRAEKGPFASDSSSASSQMLRMALKSDLESLSSAPGILPWRSLENSARISSTPPFLRP